LPLKIKVKLSLSKLTTITYLRNDEILKWIFFDTSFLQTRASTTGNSLKQTEDIWGKGIIDCSSKTMWTGVLGESIAREIFSAFGSEVSCPTIKEGKKIDLMVSLKSTDITLPTAAEQNFLVEVKNQTYFTKGTAGEKILGVSNKYCRTYDLYKMPLKILCIANAEKLMREKYNFLPEMGVPDSCLAEHSEINDFYKERFASSYIGATDLLIALSDKMFPLMSQINEYSMAGTKRKYMDIRYVSEKIVKELPPPGAVYEKAVFLLQTLQEKISPSSQQMFMSFIIICIENEKLSMDEFFTPILSVYKILRRSNFILLFKDVDFVTKTISTTKNLLQAEINQYLQENKLLIFEKLRGLEFNAQTILKIWKIERILDNE